MKITIINFGQRLIKGEHKPHKHTFGAFCGAITKNMAKYHDFVSSSNTSKIYREKEYNIIRRSFDRIYQFKMLGGFGVYSYHDGLYFLEFWGHDRRDFILHQFKCIPIDDVLHFIDARHKFDDRCVVDLIQKHFELIN